MSGLIWENSAGGVSGARFHTEIFVWEYGNPYTFSHFVFPLSPGLLRRFDPDPYKNTKILA